MESEYSSQLYEKSSLKDFESGLCNENLVINFRPSLRTSGISDYELKKNVNKLATKQAERKIMICSSSECSKKVKAKAFSTDNKIHKLNAEIQHLKIQLAELLQHVETSPCGNVPPKFASR